MACLVRASTPESPVTLLHARWNSSFTSCLITHLPHPCAFGESLHWHVGFEWGGQSMDRLFHGASI